MSETLTAEELARRTIAAINSQRSTLIPIEEHALILSIAKEVKPEEAKP